MDAVFNKGVDKPTLILDTDYGENTFYGVIYNNRNVCCKISMIHRDNKTEIDLSLDDIKDIHDITKRIIERYEKP